MPEKARTKTGRPTRNTGPRRHRVAPKAVTAHPENGAAQSLVDFLETTSQLTADERDQIVEQAIVLIERVFVHLPLKRAMHAVDPVQRLRLLRRRQAALSERAFHDEMISIFNQLRDLHTNYVLPEPYRSSTAFVPFRIEAFGAPGDRQYLITQVRDGVAADGFEKGVRVTHWNGIPIERAVELNAEREAGSNTFARFARGLASMTIRWMGMSQPPDEEEVTIRYLVAGKPRDARFEWQVITPDNSPTGVDPLAAKGEIAWCLGIDARTEAERRALKTLFAKEAVRVERAMRNVTAAAKSSGAAVEAAGLSVDTKTQSVMPDVFKEFRPVMDGRFGYVRITTFNVDDDEAFVREFIRIAELLPQNGLIIDVRGNGGGLITAGERLLQVLTPRAIEPTHAEFINTPLTLRLCEEPANTFIAAWRDSIAQSTETGATFSQGFTITSAERCNDIGQRYHGPIVLITDALCYSTTDIFAAGFQDHDVGKILGVAGNTGAGGANVWTHELLSEMLAVSEDSPFKPIPGNAAFRVAARRVIRVGKRAGVPIEDLGVVPDEQHAMTQRDILESNVDLIEHAASILAKQPAFQLRATLKERTASVVRLELETANLDRIDVIVDERPRLTVDIETKTQVVELDPRWGHAVELRGYREAVLAAATRLEI
jgi:C-terminal processing protease CtpA/Prc